MPWATLALQTVPRIQGAEPTLLSRTYQLTLGARLHRQRVQMGPGPGVLSTSIAVLWKHRGADGWRAAPSGTRISSSGECPPC